MRYRKLGRTELEISVIGLGTMTWGLQNTQAQGFEQMDYALERGINFFDTAEMYAIPPSAKTFGTTESIIGSITSNMNNTYLENVSSCSESFGEIVGRDG